VPDRPKIPPVSDRLIREMYRDDVPEPARYTLADGRVVSGQELVRLGADRRRRRGKA
jgi:hypothetical protein